MSDNSMSSLCCCELPVFGLVQPLGWHLQ